jgi:hypothetical protein
VEARVSGATCLFDPASEAEVTASQKTWLLDSGAPRTYLGSPCKDLTAAVGYNPLWCDDLGRFRTEPHVDPRAKAPMWVLDVSDQLTDIVLADRTITEERSTDSRGARNWWRFFIADSSTLQVEGVNQYTVDRSGTDLECRATPQGLTVTDYATLVSEGDKIVQDDSQVLRTIELSVRALPLLSHLDVLRYKGDSRVGDVRVQVRSYEIPLRPSDGRTRLTLEVLG